MKSAGYITISLVFFCTTTSLNAGSTPMQINAGCVRSITGIPNSSILLAGTYGGGLYKSTDMGATWNPCPISGVSYYINCVYADFNGDIYIATNSGVARSSDAGESWSVLMKSKALDVTVFRQPQSLTKTLYIGTEGVGLLSSEDDGNSFKPLTRSIPVSQVRKILIHARHPDRIIIGTSNGVYLSENRGESWSSRNIGLANLPVRSLCQDPINSDRLLVSTQLREEEISEDGDIYLTENAGSTWNKVFEELCFPYLLINPYDTSTVYAASFYSGVFYNDKSGASTGWKWMADGLESKRVYALFATQSGVFAGTSCGISFKSPQTESWTNSSTGLKATNVSAITISSDNKWYVGCTHQGIFRSMDQGKSWTRIMNGFEPSHLDVLDIEVARNSPNWIYAGMVGRLIYRSQDGGQTWTHPVSSGFISVEDVDIDPQNSQKIYITAFNEGVFRSQNGGDSWISITGDMSWNGSSQILPLSDSIILVGHHDGDVFRTSDGGSTYTKIILNPGIWVRTGVKGMIRHRDNANHIVLATDRGLHYSTDGGVSFSSANPEEKLNVFHCIAAAPSSPDTMYTGGDHGRLLRSVDAGIHWSDFSQDLPDSAVSSIAVSLDDPDRLLIGLSGCGVYLIDN